MNTFLFTIFLISIAAHGQCEKEVVKKTEKRGIMDGLSSGIESGVTPTPNSNEILHLGANSPQNTPYGHNLGNDVTGRSAQNDESRETTGNQGLPVQVPAPISQSYPRLLPFNVPHPAQVPLFRSYPPVQMQQPVQVTVQKAYSIPVTENVPVQQHPVALPAPQPYPINIHQQFPVRIPHSLLFPAPQTIPEHIVQSSPGNSVESRSIAQSGNPGNNMVETGPTKGMQQQPSPVEESLNAQKLFTNSNQGIANTAYAGGVTQQSNVENPNNKEANAGAETEQTKLNQGNIGSILELQNNLQRPSFPLNGFGSTLNSGFGSLQIPDNSGIFGGSFIAGSTKTGFGSDIGNSFLGQDLSLGSGVFGKSLGSFGTGSGYSFGSNLGSFTGLSNNYGLSLGTSSLPSVFGFGSSPSLLSNSFGSDSFTLKH